jgi:Asp/Glu/hydantoin racemase
MNDRELIHAALQWYAVYVRRKAIGTEKRRLEAHLKSDGHSSLFSPLYQQQANTARELTEAKRKELAALRLLAKACAKQRGKLDTADVIDLGGAIAYLPAGD